MTKSNIFLIKVIRALFFVCAIALSYPLVAQRRAKSALEYFDAGLSEQNNEDWYSASEYFMEAINANPAYTEAWFHLSQCSYQLGEYDLSLSQLESAEKYSKDDDAIQNLRGMIFITQGKLDDARAIFENVLKRTPNNIDARFGLAELDLFNGRMSAAFKQYNEALKRQNDNRKALLSLAVISAQLGKYDNALRYINESIDYYSGEKEIYYLRAVVYSMKGELDNAEQSCHTALQIDADYDKAQELLSKILFMMGRYEDAIPICDTRIERNRFLNSAWYLKGLCFKEQGRISDAIDTWDSGVKITKDDEVMRAALEILANNATSLKDPRRKEWAQYHIDCAGECERRYDKSGAIYEYQRALKIEPTNEKARMSYAKMLKLNGLHELYLEQLLFIRQNQADADKAKASYKQTMMSDTIEAYSNLLQDTLAKQWDVQPFYLDKTRWQIGIYYYKDATDDPATVNQIHMQNNRVASEFASDIFSGIAQTSVRTFPVPIRGFGDAYNKARNNGMDYFITLNIDEGERSVTLSYTMYSARTGSKILENSFYATGNARYTNVFRRFQAEVQNNLTTRANIVSRDGKSLLCDYGKSEGANKGDIFDIVKKGTITTATNTKGVTYKKEDTLGTFTIDTVGEEVSSGTLTYKGVYDKINIGDELILVAGKKIEQPSEPTTPQPAPDKLAIQKENAALLEQDLNIKHVPSVIDLIRGIY